jgi:hypothetical protein
MPGQRKRKRQQTERQQGVGHWEVLLETGDETELRAALHRMRAEHPQLDPSMLRTDTFCGRLQYPTSYRLSRFVPEGVARS